MRIVEIPYLYTVKGVLPKHRNPSVFGVVGRTPASLTEVDDAPVVVRAQGHSQGEHLLVECNESYALKDRWIDYRLHDNRLWRPARASTGGDMVAADDWNRRYERTPIVVFEVGGNLAAFEDAWRELAITDRRRFVGKTAHCYAISQGSLPSYRYQSRYNEIHDEGNLRIRHVDWQNGDELKATAVRRAESEFMLIGGVLHVRTPGPWIRVDSYAKTSATVDLDGPREATVTTSFRADRQDAVDAWIALSGKRPERHGAIEFLDIEGYKRGVPSETGCLLAFAAHKAALSEHIAGEWKYLPGHVAEIAGRLRTVSESLEAVLPYEAFDEWAAEDLVREMDACFPLHRLAESGDLAITHSPVHEILTSLDWRLRNAPEQRLAQACNEEATPAIC